VLRESGPGQPAILPYGPRSAAVDSVQTLAKIAKAILAGLHIWSDEDRPNALTSYDRADGLGDTAGGVYF